MKPIIKFFVAISIIFSDSFCNAQSPAQWSAFQQSELRGCTFIFEGNVTQQKVYNGKRGRMICSVIQITKIYRGNPQIKLGSIKLITKQNKGIADAGPDIGRGHYIIFGRTYTLGGASDSSTLISIVTDNLLILQTNDWIAFTGGGAVWGWRRPTHYNTVDSLYSFFKENGLEVQEEVK
jgi:hypothetical protein